MDIATKYVFTQTHCHEQELTQSQLLSGVLLVRINFPSPRLVVMLSFPCYLLIAGGRTNRFMPFPRALTPSEALTVSSGILT